MTDPKPRCDTLVSLRDYLESRLDGNQLAVDAAKELMESRKELMESRMRHQDVELDRLRTDVSTLKEWRSEQRGKASMGSVYLALAIGVSGLLVSLVAVLQEMFG